MNYKAFSGKNKVSMAFILSLAMLSFVLWYQIPLMNNSGHPLLRVDEGLFFYLAEEIHHTGYLPEYLSKFNNGQIQAYPPTLPTIIGLQTFFVGYDIFTLAHYFNFFLALIVFISGLAMYTFTKEIYGVNIAIFSGVLFVISPIIRYKLLYIHATYYANFIAILFILLIIYSINKYIYLSNKRYLVLAVVFFTALIHTHLYTFLVFGFILVFCYLSTIPKNMLKRAAKCISICVLLGMVLSLPYITSTPLVNHHSKDTLISGETDRPAIFYRIKNINDANINHPLLALEMINSLFPIPYIILIMVGMIYLRSTNSSRNRFLLILVAFLLCATFSWKVSQWAFIAPYRYLTFFIIFIPIISGIVINKLWRLHRYLAITALILLVAHASVLSSTIETTFTEKEFKTILELSKEIQGPVISDYRLNPWVPLLTNQTVVFSKTDIFTSSNSGDNHLGRLLTCKTSSIEKAEIMKQMGAEYIILIKGEHVKDGRRYKGLSEDHISRFQEPEFIIVAEKENIIIFRLNSELDTI